MWNWLVSGLASGATLILYDGSPFADDGKVLLDAIDRERITVFGTSAKFISGIEKQGSNPANRMTYRASALFCRQALRCLTRVSNTCIGM